MKLSGESGAEYPGYKIYQMWYDSKGWAVEGELGFARYPGTMTEELVREYYRTGRLP